MNRKLGFEIKRVLLAVVGPQSEHRRCGASWHIPTSDYAPRDRVCFAVHAYSTLRPGGRAGDLFGPSIPRLGIRRVDNLRRGRQPVVSAITVARMQCVYPHHLCGTGAVRVQPGSEPVRRWAQS